MSRRYAAWPLSSRYSLMVFHPRSFLMYLAIGKSTLGMLTNREKALIANSLRPARKLNEMLSELGMGRSSCQYQVEAMRRPDKHAGARRRARSPPPPAPAATAIAGSAWT